MEFVTPLTDIRSLEKDIRNKFKWSWLEETDSNGDLLSSYIQKLKLPGLVYCNHCKAKVDYRGKGKSLWWNAPRRYPLPRPSVHSYPSSTARTVT